jgi:NifU-like protein
MADATANQGTLGTTPVTQPPFSKKIESVAAAPRHRGAFFTEDATSKDLALITAKHKDIKIYWLVDPESDRVYDAKFFSYGGPISMAMGEVLCEKARGNKLEDVLCISLYDIDVNLRDTPEQPSTAAPVEEAYANLEPLLKTAEDSYASAKALALASIQMKKSEASRPSAFEELTERDEKWLAQSKDAQIHQIDTIIARDIRPGLNMDGGDMEIVDIEEGRKLTIRYQGACGGCGSATGATLSYIEDTLRRELFGAIQVIPVDLHN